MQHALKTTGDQNELVRADGLKMPLKDVDQLIFHVLPQLFVEPDHLGWLTCERISLTLHSVALGDALFQPEGGVVIGQPLPNRQFFVGGSRDTRYGWIVPIPKAGEEFDLTMRWVIERGAGVEPSVLEQTFFITPLAGSYNAYTMDRACWHRVRKLPEGEAPIHRQTWLAIPPEKTQPLRQAAIECEVDGEEPFNIVALTCSERLEIPSVPVSDLWSIEEFQAEQHHEKKQHVKFRKFVAEHRANACVEMPASVLVEAVDRARRIPYEEGFLKKGRGGCEHHPAIKVLVEWWNANAPDNATRVAGFAVPWVRIGNESEYACGYYETPEADFESFTDHVSANARVGDLVLVEFMKGSQHFSFDSGGLQTYYVTGDKAVMVGVGQDRVDSGEYDEAWYTLEALSDFPRRFPQAWKALRSIR